MNYQELIHKYIDGDLSAEEETQFFSEMSSNGNMRTEFQEQMRLHRLAHSDMAATSVPPELTSSVFGSLGVPLPEIPVENTAVSSASATGKFPLIPVLYTAILTSLLTFGIAYYFLNKGNEQSITFTSPSKKNDKRVFAENNSTDNTLLTEIDENKKEKANEKVPTIVYRYIQNPETTHINEPIHNNVEKDSVEKESDEVPIYTDEGISISNVYSKNVSNTPFDRNNIKPLFAENRTLFDNVLNTESKQFSIVFRSMPFARFTPTIDLAKESAPDINNIGMGLYYDMSDDHALGIEIGREIFAQEFTRSISNQTVIYRQNPSLYWYGISYRFSASDLSIGEGWLTPYLQGFAGWAQNGPIVKLSGGFRFLPENQISLFAGIEASRLYFPVQAVYFFSDKYSITAGASVRF